jgi:hypothetical protein
MNELVAARLVATVIIAETKYKEYQKALADQEQAQRVYDKHFFAKPKEESK